MRARSMSRRSGIWLTGILSRRISRNCPVVSSEQTCSLQYKKPRIDSLCRQSVECSMQNASVFRGVLFLDLSATSGEIPVAALAIPNQNSLYTDDKILTK